MTKPVALIAGVSGAVGTALARELSEMQHWQVHGVARRKPDTVLTNVSYLQADLSNAEECKRLFAPLSEVTHIFYCARATHAEEVVEDAESNLLLLRNLVESLESVAVKLAHVHLVQGGKYYGVHVGPFTTPAVEEQARAPIPNFNYDQQDYLQDRSLTSTWTWTASRPNTLLHYSPDNGRNLVSSLGTYAAICRELGAALDFPGPQGALDSLTQVTSLDLLARAIAWMSTEPQCANQGFNVSNTDLLRWSAIWPRLADEFNMPVGTVRPLKLTDILSARSKIWLAVCQKNNLVPVSLEQVANWGYLDATLERHWDEILCHNKMRRLGFDDWDDSQARIFSLLEQYRENNLLPR